MKNEFYPSRHSAKNALNAYSGKIKRSINHIFERMQIDALFTDPSIEYATQIMNTSQRFHPEVHYFHNKLIVAMKNQDTKGATSNCHSLIRSLITRKDDNILQIASIGACRWEHDALTRAIDSASVETGLSAYAMPVASEIFDQQNLHVQEGLALLLQHDPPTHAEIETLIQCIKLFSGKVMQGLSDTQVFGEIYIRTPRKFVDHTPYYVEHIVHETAHTYLNCLMADDPIVTNCTDEKFPSPLREDLRPMYAVYHATFVAARMALTFKRIFEHTGDHRWVKMLAEVADETIRGARIITASGMMTDRGRALITDICDLSSHILNMDIWNDFDFDKPALHRCGAGAARYSNLRKALYTQ